MKNLITLAMAKASQLSKWTSKHGVMGVVAVVGVSALVLFSGVGVTMAATGSFQAKPSTTPSQPLPATAAPSSTYGYADDHQVTIDTKSNPQAGAGNVSFGEGLTSTVGNYGVQFSFRGPCQPSGLLVRVNTGLIVSQGGTCPGNNPQGMAVTSTYNWQSGTSYCSQGVSLGIRSVRAEIGPYVGEWISIPAQYLICTPPVAVPSPVAPAPASPTTSPSASSSPSATSSSPTPTTTPTP